ncbi:MAG: hypothetical protein EKK41_02150 [Hyphomicrobiales bacterium]|nr:MAG: hypothetical protein EKK41_02150 [Hyphomicrobiales bacterium]
MTKSEMVERLQKLSYHSDIQTLHAAEANFSRKMSNYVGYQTLLGAFTCLFLEAVLLHNRIIVPAVIMPISPEHGLFLGKLARCFATLRAARIAAGNGYPFQGLTMLRNIYDDCVLASAVLQGMTRFEALAGAKNGEAFDNERMKKNRISLERTIRRKMDGKESGLSDEILENLAVVDRMYDFETHGGQLSIAYHFGFILGKGPLPVVPEFDEQKAALFMNRDMETSWMVHRLLPHMQLDGHPSLPKNWGDKWKVIDESFNHVMLSLQDLGKPYFKSITEFVHAKFPFDASSRFRL